MYEYQATGGTNQRDRVAGYLTAQQQSQIENENAINAGLHVPPALLPSNSIATLCNIGNSCYLNSVIYTLRFAPLFLHKLHHLVEEMSQIYQRLGKNKLKISSLGRNVPGLPGANNRSWSSKDLASLGGVASLNGGGSNTMLNDSPFVPKTSRQIATEKLHELYQNLHHNESLDSLEPYHSGTFLQAVQDVSSIFEGNQQQDAHEFLMCILDTVRETCQSLNKMLAEYPDAICNVAGSAPTITEQLDSNMMAPIKKSSIFSRRPKRKPTQVISTAAVAPAAANPSDAVRPNKLDSPMKERKANTILETDSTDLSMASTSTSVSTGDGSVGGDDKESGGGGSTVDMSEQIRKMGLDFFRNDFEGVTVSTTKCLTCENVKEKKETMIDISVPITNTENFDSLEHPQFFFQNACITKEYFRGENKYRCDTCRGYTEAIRTTSFELLPRLLIIQLKRFSGGMEKINSFIPTPLTLHCFCKQCCSLPEHEKKHIYKLYSVITHVGATMSVGHYIAYTCSLDILNEYKHCPKEKFKADQLAAAAAKLNELNGQLGSAAAESASTTSSSSSSSTTSVGLIKKMIFKRTKASSSGDITKNLKNGLNKMMINGIDKLNLSNNSNITSNNGNSINKETQPMVKAQPCQGQQCCGIYMKASSVVNGNNFKYNNGHSDLAYNNSASNGIADVVETTLVNGGKLEYMDAVDGGTKSPETGQTATENGSDEDGGGGGGGSGGSTGYDNDYYLMSTDKQVNQDYWYMCDDDKIKVMSRREFQELLMPNNKIMITPYLLFFARFNAQPNLAGSSTSS